jgi:hypothetical protein
MSVLHRRASTVTLTLLVATCAATSGCASRAAPFDKLDKAQLTIHKLQPPQPAPGPVPLPGGLAIPGLPPELQQMGQAWLDTLQQGGIPIPGLPGMGGPQTPAAPPPQLFRQQWQIARSAPVMDEDLRNELLDLFGDDDSFNDQRGNCFNPEMAFSFVDPQFPEPVDVVVSLACNQAVGYGFQWPHPSSGLTSDSSTKLSSVYQSNFPPGM